MTKLLLINIFFLIVIFSCKTTKITHQKQAKSIGFIDYCAIEDSIIATNYYQSYYHTELRPKTKILMDNRSIPDSIVTFWKDKGYRVVTMQMQAKPYVIDSGKYISSALYSKIDEIFKQRFKDSLFMASGKQFSIQELNILITKRKKGIDCK